MKWWGEEKSEEKSNKGREDGLDEGRIEVWEQGHNAFFSWGKRANSFVKNVVLVSSIEENEFLDNFTTLYCMKMVAKSTIYYLLLFISIYRLRFSR